MKLVSVYRGKAAPKILYDLLKSRTPEVNISHKKLPTFEEHKAFVRSVPYRYWYLIRSGAVYIGAVYLTLQDEIGAFLFPKYQKRGLGPVAIKLLMEKHPRPRFLANIAPANKKSARTFKRLGFKLIQHTWEFRA